MRAALLAVALALPAAAGELGGHELPQTAAQQAGPADDRKATLDEMWQRRLLPPDQSSWSPSDLDLLNKIRSCERVAIAFLKRKPGGSAPWTVRSRVGFLWTAKLTKEGYERYLFLLSQDAIEFFEAKGADAKWVFKLKDWNGHSMFDGGGRITEHGRTVYDRARLNLEVYWAGPDGQAYGTRRPPTKTP